MSTACVSVEFIVNIHKELSIMASHSRSFMVTSRALAGCAGGGIALDETGACAAAWVGSARF